MSSKRYPEKFKIQAVKQITDRGKRASNLTGHLTETTPERVYFRTKVRKSDAVR